jgi:hypothetical protein
MNELWMGIIANFMATGLTYFKLKTEYNKLALMLKHTENLADKYRKSHRDLLNHNERMEKIRQEGSIKRARKKAPPQRMRKG